LAARATTLDAGGPRQDSGFPPRFWSGRPLRARLRCRWGRAVPRLCPAPGRGASPHRQLGGPGSPATAEPPPPHVPKAPCASPAAPQRGPRYNLTSHMAIDAGSVWRAEAAKMPAGPADFPRWLLFQLSPGPLCLLRHSQPAVTLRQATQMLFMRPSLVRSRSFIRCCLLTFSHLSPSRHPMIRCRGHVPSPGLSLAPRLRSARFPAGIFCATPGARLRGRWQ